MSRTFASLAIPNYRKFFVGALVSNMGTWVQNIGLSWLVLTELTNNSSSALGLVTALQFLGIPILATYAGGVADRFSKRKILIVTQTLLAMTAATSFLLIFTGVVQLWHIYILAFIQGCITAFDNPCRQAFVSEIVADSMVPNAVGLNSMSFNGARLIGPGAAGFLIAAFGVAPAMLINSITFLAMLIALVVMDTKSLHPAPRAERKGAARGGLKYVLAHPDIIVLMIIVFFLGTFGLNFQIFNAVMATEAFGRGASDFGMLGTIMALGTLAAALRAARRRRPRLKIILLALVTFSLSCILAAFSPNYYVYALLLVPCGFFSLTVMTSCNVAVQMGAEREYRGRVMAIYTAIFMGGTPLGSPIIGWLGDQFGDRKSVV